MTFGQRGKNSQIGNLLNVLHKKGSQSFNFTWEKRENRDIFDKPLKVWEWNMFYWYILYNLSVFALTPVIS